jgi:hypothetical protein
MMFASFQIFGTTLEESDLLKWWRLVLLEQKQTLSEFSMEFCREVCCFQNVLEYSLRNH